jgi:hypothetical protein
VYSFFAPRFLTEVYEKCTSESNLRLFMETANQKTWDLMAEIVLPGPNGWTSSEAPMVEAD